MARRLAAIFAADVVGYSKLMAEDEAGTLTALKAHRRDLFDPETERHGGRIVKLMGDGALVEFPSVVDAVECAIQVQQALATADGKIKLRIGINLGDVIIDGDDIYGEGVNVAARLQALAEPGGISISSVVHESLGNRVEAAFIDTGEHQVKNIARPIRVFRWWSQAGAPPIAPAMPPLGLPDKPSIAVLPFTNMSGDAQKDYFSEGITSDIVAKLGKFRDLFVIADTSSFAYRDNAVAVQDVGRELGVQHVLKGSIRAMGGKVRISAQLIEATSGQSIWAESYNRVLDDIFELQDEITQTIVMTLVGRLESAAQARVVQKGDANLSIYDRLLLGRHYVEKGSKQDILKARAIFEEALHIDSNHARTHVELAGTFYSELSSQWCKSPETTADRFFEFAQKAVALDELDSRAHLALGAAYYRVKSNYDFAEAQLERALELNPNDVWNHCSMGFLLTCAGRLEEGATCDHYALRLNPLLPDPCLYTIGLAQYLARDYDKAIATFGKMSILKIELVGCLAASYAQLGRIDEAQASAAEFKKRVAQELANDPGSDVDRWQAYWMRLIPLRNQEDRDHLFDGLRKAGLPA